MQLFFPRVLKSTKKVKKVCFLSVYAVPGSQIVGKTRKKKAREKLFSCLRFLNSVDPTISEPATGYFQFTSITAASQGLSVVPTRTKMPLKKGPAKMTNIWYNLPEADKQLLKNTL